MKKVILTICGATMLGIASFAQVQENQENASPNYNQENPAVGDRPIQNDQTPVQDQSQNPQDQTQDVQGEPQNLPPQSTPPVAPEDDGTNAVKQGQSRETGQPTQDQTDQATDPSMERPSEVTPVEGKSGPNGEAIFEENGKYYYMNEAGEKTKIKKSALRDKSK